MLDPTRLNFLFQFESCINGNNYMQLSFICNTPSPPHFSYLIFMIDNVQWLFWAILGQNNFHSYDFIVTGLLKTYSLVLAYWKRKEDKESIF